MIEQGISAKTRLINCCQLLVGFLLVFGLFSIIQIQNIEAADCGDGVGVCVCGDTVIANYTLSADLNCPSSDGHGLVVGANDITIDGSGFSLSGNGYINGYGIFNNGNDNVTITGFDYITNFGIGIYFNNLADDGIITDNVVRANTQYGIKINYSSGTILRDNTFIDNTYNFSVYGVSQSFFEQDIDTSNFVQDKPLYYLYNVSDQTYDGNVLGEIGLFWCIYCSNVTIRNATLADRNYIGVNFYNTSTSTVENINVSQAYYGVNVYNSHNDTISNSTITKSYAGIYFNSTSNNTISNNWLETNEFAIYLDYGGHLVTGNKFVRNIHETDNDSPVNTLSSNQAFDTLSPRMLTFNEISQEKNVNDSINFSFTMRDARRALCPTCSYTVTTSPETTVSSTQVDEDVSGSFTVSQEGIYSLIVEITDSSSNSVKRKFSFFVGSTNSTTTRYYFRGVDPTHGQPYGNDAKTFLYSQPSSDEVWRCGIWVQNSIDEIPPFPLSVLKDVDLNFWYKLNVNGTVGLQRYVKYSSLSDTTTSASSTAEYLWTNKTFNNVDWPMDYYSSWYWFTFKLTGNGSPLPFLLTTPEQPSYMDVTYSYLQEAAVNSLSNFYINLLSLIKDSDGDAFIVLENPISSATTTDIVLDYFNRPFSSVTTTITSASSTSFTSPSVSTSTTTTIESVNMAITPASDSVIISISTWNTSGDYAKQWTASSTASPTVSHTVGDLSPNTYYTVYYTKQGEDQARLTTLEANGSGEISFDYDQGFSTVTFNITEDTTGPVAFSLASPASGTITSASDIPLSWNASSDTESSLAKYQLYIDSTLDTDNIATTTTSQVPTTPLACGSHSWYVRAYDNASNYTNSSNTFSITRVCGGGIYPLIVPTPIIPDQDQPIDIDQADNQTNQDNDQNNNQGSSTSTIPIFIYPSRLFKSPTSPKVYVISEHNYKRHLPNETIYLAYGYLWDQIKTILEVDLNRYLISKLIKLVNDPKVYLIQNSTKRWLENELTFNNLGLNWQAISAVNQEEFDYYQTLEPITQANYPEVKKTLENFTELLSFGSIGEEVKKLQQILKDLGFFSYPKITGYYGSITTRAVEEFQQYYGLEVSGNVDLVTIEKLNQL